jgi:parvulin-like peptidyl-prolyl isomerase
MTGTRTSLGRALSEQSGLSQAAAVRALAQALEQPQRFAELAQQLCACPSAAQGGNLGQISRGQTVPELETFLFNLEPGQICPVPVKTRLGYHVVRLDRRIEGRQLPFGAVRERIAVSSVSNTAQTHGQGHEPALVNGVRLI